MKVNIRSSRLVKPIYQTYPCPTSHCIPLSIFDRVTYNQHVAAIFAYRPPTPSNETIELGLKMALGVYREWAGRLGRDNDGNPIIILNDEGIRFVEASVDSVLDKSIVLRPSSSLLTLHPSLEGAVELVQVQITRFLCGSMVVGFTAHHLVADGRSTSNFLVAWSQACRGPKISPLPFHDRTIFPPRNPPKFEFEHKGVEYVPKKLKKVYPLIPFNEDDIVVHKVHYSFDFLSKLKAKTSSMNGNNKSFSTFESLMAHLWRSVTRARGLNESETTRVRISVDGRARLNPRVPDEFFGNLVLWAFASAKVKDLLTEPLRFAAKLLRDAVIKIDDNYFKSFIDFTNYKVNEDDLVPNTTADTQESILWPDLEVDSWLRFPFYDLDLGQGGPYIFMPSFFPTEGMVFLLPSCIGDGSIDVFVPLFQQSLMIFKQICYSLD